MPAAVWGAILAAFLGTIGVIVAARINGRAALTSSLDARAAKVLEDAMDYQGREIVSLRQRVDVLDRLGPNLPAPPTPPEGFLMALTEVEQREILAKVRATDLRVQELDQQLTDGADPRKAGISKRILDALARLEARKG